MDRKRSGLLLLALLWLLLAVPARAKVQDPEAAVEELGLGELQETLEKVLDTELNFEDTVFRAAGGGELFSLKDLGGSALEKFKAELQAGKSLFLSVLTLCICAALFLNFSGIFKNQQIAEVSFELVYMLLFLSLLKSFQGSLEVTVQALADLGDFMRVLAPSYFLAVTMASNPVTAGAFYPLVLGIVYGVRWVMEEFLLPVMGGYLVLVFVNHLTEEEYLSRFAELVYSGLCWALRTVILAVAGIQAVQGMISPAVDAFRTTAVSKVISGVPVIGSTTGAAADLLLGSGMLIKNGIGAVGLLVILLICAAPLVKLGAWILLLKGLAAAAEPVSDKRITGCIADVAKAGTLLLRVLFTAAILFMLSVAVVSLTTGIGR